MSGSTWGQVTRTVNRRIKQAGMTHKGKFDVIGSFFAFRIEDEQGVVTVREFTQIVQLVESTLNEIGVKHTRRVSEGYHSNGCVVNWERA